MEYDNQNQQKYYSKKSLWKWVLLYVVVAVVAYGVIYYFFFANKGGYTYTPSQDQMTNTADNPIPTPSPTSSPATVSVTISNYAYNSNNITVHKGDTVTWTNNDSVAHNVVGNNGGPGSQYINQGQTYSYTFTTVGTFPYYCSIHPNMKGVVSVIN